MASIQHNQADRPMPPRTRGPETAPPVKKTSVDQEESKSAENKSADAAVLSKDYTPPPPPRYIEERFERLRLEAETGCLSAAEELQEKPFASLVYNNIDTYFEAARFGHGWGYYNLGWCYEFGLGTGYPPNIDYAFYYYRKAAHLGHPLGEYALGLCYYEDKDYVLAVDMFKRSAASGCDWGEKAIASCYFNGTVVKADRKKAEEYHRRSADKGNKVAQYWLYILRDEYGLSYEEARHFLKLSSRNKYRPAMDIDRDNKPPPKEAEPSPN